VVPSEAILRCRDGAPQQRERVCHVWRLVEFACQPCCPLLYMIGKEWNK
jgi:hypothetical protein